MTIVDGWITNVVATDVQNAFSGLGAWGWGGRWVIVSTCRCWPVSGEGKFGAMDISQKWDIFSEFVLYDFMGSGWLLFVEKHLVSGGCEVGAFFLLDSFLESYFDQWISLRDGKFLANRCIYVRRTGSREIIYFCIVCLLVNNGLYFLCFLVWLGRCLYPFELCWRLWGVLRFQRAAEMLGYGASLLVVGNLEMNCR